MIVSQFLLDSRMTKSLQDRERWTDGLKRTVNLVRDGFLYALPPYRSDMSSDRFWKEPRDRKKRNKSWILVKYAACVSSWLGFVDGCKESIFALLAKCSAEATKLVRLIILEWPKTPTSNDDTNDTIALINVSMDNV